MTFPIQNLPFGAVARDTPEFAVLTSYARRSLAAMGFGKGADAGFFRKLWRGMKLSVLQDELAPYGWSVKADGEMYRVPVRKVEKAVTPVATAPRESNEDVVRATMVNAGYVVDPMTGRKRPPHERGRWVAS
jgi:hypothetical protein